MGRDRQQNSFTRRIIEHPDFKKQCKELIGRFERFNEVWMAIRIDVQDYAHENPNESYGYYWKETMPMFGLPSFVYTYTYDDKAVTLFSIYVNDE